MLVILKYALATHPDEGVICTVENVVYLAHVQGHLVHAVDRTGHVVKINFDPSEPNFKRALRSKDYDELFRIIDSGRLIGQSIIQYLRQTGHADIALKFVRDPQTRMDLALEANNLEVAIEAASKLDKPDVWQSLADEAMKQGNTKLLKWLIDTTRTGQNYPSCT